MTNRETELPPHVFADTMSPMDILDLPQPRSVPRVFFDPEAVPRQTLHECILQVLCSATGDATLHREERLARAIRDLAACTLRVGGERPTQKFLARFMQEVKP